MTIKYCYICSAARCGSTITDMFLGGHSKVASLGELNLLGKAISIGDCSCGVAVKDCSEWNKVFDSVGSLLKVDLRDDPYGLRLWDARAFVEIDKSHQTFSYFVAVKFRALLLEIRELLFNKLKFQVRLPAVLKTAVKNKLTLYDVILKSWDKEVVVDSSKNIREAVELYKQSPENVRIILMARDGRGTYLSRRKSGWGKRESLKGWLKYYKRALRLKRTRLPDEAIMLVHYEDLASSPEKIGSSICEFIGLEFEPDMLDLSKNTRHLVNGNDTRFSAKKIRLDEKWHAELVGDEMEYFLRHGSAMNKNLNYNLNN